MAKYQSTKVFDNYSVALRQWKAAHSHCELLHGYALKFKVTFVGNLDELNWVCDFGCYKRNGIKDHMNYMFDHTTIVEKDDPELNSFKNLEEKGLIQLRILNHVGCEKFAEYVFNYIDTKVFEETEGRVRVLKVESFEGGTNNSALYEPNNVRSTLNKRKINQMINKSKTLI